MGLDWACKLKTGRSLPAVDVGLQRHGGQTGEKPEPKAGCYPFFCISRMRLQNRAEISGTVPARLAITARLRHTHVCNRYPLRGCGSGLWSDRFAGRGSERSAPQIQTLLRGLFSADSGRGQIPEKDERLHNSICPDEFSSCATRISTTVCQNVPGI